MPLPNSAAPSAGASDSHEGFPIRLQLFLSRYGQWSRRQAEAVIESGRVTVDGVGVTQPFFRVEASSAVCVDGRPLEPARIAKTYMLHKPVGYLCSSFDPQHRPLAVQLIPHGSERLYTVGRLDFRSSGLILVTNDGPLAHRIMHPSFEVEKEYEVACFQKISEELLKTFKKGFSIDQISYRIRAYRILNERLIRLSLIEGKNREIRRFFEYHHIGIQSLQRVRIGGLHLGSLQSGESRLLSEADIRSVFN